MKIFAEHQDRGQIPNGSPIRICSMSRPTSVSQFVGVDLIRVPVVFEFDRQEVRSVISSPMKNDIS